MRLKRSLWIPFWFILLLLVGSYSFLALVVACALACVHLTVLFEAQEDVFIEAQGTVPVTLYQLLQVTIDHKSWHLQNLPLYQASEQGIAPITDWFTCNLNGETALVLETISREAHGKAYSGTGNN